MEQFQNKSTVPHKAGWEGKETEVKPEDLPDQRKHFSAFG